MAGGGSARIKELRYQVMLALYLPILLYSFSTYDLKDKSVAAKEVEPVLVGGQDNVVLGQDFTANAYLKASKLAKGKKITLKTEDEKVEISGNESIKVATANLLGEDEDKKEIKYSVEMEYGQLEGTASQTMEGSFTVRRPELVSKSEAANSLYRKTRNKIRIDVPGLENRPLRLESSAGGAVDGRQLSISPASNTVTVRAYLPNEDGENTYLGKKEFPVIDPPRPQLKVFDAKGSEIVSGDNIARARPTLNFKVEPDAEYGKSYPQDANYRIRRAKVSLRKGLKASQEIGTFNLGSDMTLNRELIRGLREAGAQAKDRLLIKLQSVVRVNHAGEAIPVNLNQSSMSYSFQLS